MATLFLAKLKHGKNKTSSSDTFFCTNHRTCQVIKCRKKETSKWVKLNSHGSNLSVETWSKDTPRKHKQLPVAWRWTCVVVSTSTLPIQQRRYHSAYSTSVTSVGALQSNCCHWRSCHKWWHDWRSNSCAHQASKVNPSWSTVVLNSNKLQHASRIHLHLLCHGVWPSRTDAPMPRFSNRRIGLHQSKQLLRLPNVHLTSLGCFVGFHGILWENDVLWWWVNRWRWKIYRRVLNLHFFIVILCFVLNSNIFNLRHLLHRFLVLAGSPLRLALKPQNMTIRI